MDGKEERKAGAGRMEREAHMQALMEPARLKLKGGKEARE